MTSVQRHCYTKDEELRMWKFFIKKFSERKVDAIKCSHKLWAEYVANEECNRSIGSITKHFVRHMLPKLATAPLTDEEIWDVCQLCCTKFEERTLKALEKRLKCKLRFNDNGVIVKASSDEQPGTSNETSAKNVINGTNCASPNPSSSAELQQKKRKISWRADGPRPLTEEMKVELEYHNSLIEENLNNEAKTKRDLLNMKEMLCLRVKLIATGIYPIENFFLGVPEHVKKELVHLAGALKCCLST